MTDNVVFDVYAALDNELVEMTGFTLDQIREVTTALDEMGILDYDVLKEIYLSTEELDHIDN